MGWKEDLILRPFYVSGNTLVIVNRSNRVTALFLNTPITQRQPTRQRTTNVTEINKRALGSKYLSGNNLPRINVIRGKVFPDKYLHAIGACWLISTAFVVVSHVGCLGVTGVLNATSDFLISANLNFWFDYSWWFQPFGLNSLFLYEVLKFVEMLRSVSRSLWPFILYMFIFCDCFFFLFSSGEPGLVDRVLALHAGSRGFDSHRGHMS